MAMEAYKSKYPDHVQTDVHSNARQSCYKARDAFYACIEKEANKKPSEVACVGLLYPAECKKTRLLYDSSCRKTWVIRRCQDANHQVRHFDRQYCAKKAAQRLLDDNEARRGPMSLPATIKTAN